MNELLSPIDDEVDPYIVSMMIKNYGDLLKVSRTRGINKPLPSLRRYVSENPYILESYKLELEEEIRGQGLEQDLSLQALVVSQAEALKGGDSKNNTKFADEIKSIISKGRIDAEAIKSKSVESNKDFEAQVLNVIEEPLKVELDKLSVSVGKEVRRRLLLDFEVFSKWCFEIQMGFKFQMQDFHSIIFETCQKVVDGKIDRLVVTIPPRHSKTQILSIFLPLYSFCHNPSSHNIITSYAEDKNTMSSLNLFNSVKPLGAIPS